MKLEKKVSPPSAKAIAFVQLGQPKFEFSKNGWRGNAGLTQDVAVRQVVVFLGRYGLMPALTAALTALNACASVWPLVATLHPAAPAVHAGVFANGSAACASTFCHTCLANRPM